MQAVVGIKGDFSQGVTFFVYHRHLRESHSFSVSRGVSFKLRSRNGPIVQGYRYG